MEEYKYTQKPRAEQALFAMPRRYSINAVRQIYAEAESNASLLVIAEALQYK